MKLNDKVIIVTGGASGIGKATAIAFAKEGAKVVLSERTTSCSETVNAIKNIGKDAIVIKADVSKSDEINQLVKNTADEYGKIDVLFTNAGIVNVKPVVEMTDDEWNNMLNVNLTGYFRCCRAVLPYMIKQHNGKIICVSSTLGSVIGFQGLAHYSASKAGVEGFIKTLALEAAPYGITVNAISPGAVQTRVYTKEMIDEFAKLYPLGRVAYPEDVAAVAVFLASDDAKYITGRAIVVDGGQSVRP